MKIKAISIYMLGLLGMGTSTSGFANPQEEHVLVTVPVHRQSSQNALPITVINDEELRDKTRTTLGESLQMQAGLNNASFGPAVGQPVIRGQQGARVTVLQNSTSVADASAVSPDHAVASEPILAEGIEILRGPSTLLYGGGAIGGVVNILDQRIPQESHAVQGRVELRHGSVNDESTVVGKVSGGGTFMFYLDGLLRNTNDTNIPGFSIHEDEHDETEHEEHENSFGVIENSASEAESITFGSSVIFSNGYLGFAVNALNSEYGIPPGSHIHAEEEGEEGEEPEEHEENIRIDLQQTRYDVRGDWHNVTSYLEHARWYLTYTDYLHTEFAVYNEHADEPEEEHEDEHAHGTEFAKRTLENRLEFVHSEWRGWHGAMGLQIKNKHFSAKGDEVFIPDVDEDAVGVFILEDFHAQVGLYELGIRVDNNKINLNDLPYDASFTNVSYSTSGLWTLTEHFNLGVALSHAERSPTVEELYSNVGRSPGSYVPHSASGVIEVGNAQLDKESSRNIDVTLSYVAEDRDGFITVFYNDFSDFIYLRNTQEPQDDWLIYAFTPGDAEFYGVEVQYQQHWQRLDARIFADAIRGQLDNGVDLPRLPPARIGTELSTYFNRVRAFVSVLHATKQDRPGENETSSEAYTRWDLGLEASLNTMEGLVFVKVKNATDEEIRESTSFLRDIAPAAGRSVEAGLRFSF